jgi:cytochrome c oxidase subunit IV
MDSHSHGHDVKKEIRIYMLVFGALLFLTIVTVAVSYLHLNIFGAVMVALFVATIKAALVACFFMHLISERKLIYIILGVTVIFFGSVMTIPFNEMPRVKITGSSYVETKGEYAH